MFFEKIKRIPAVFIVCALLFTTVFSCAYTANASEQKSFTPRLTEPSKSNSSDVKYYYSDENVFYKYDYGMPNCTAYAWGRAYELLGKKPTLSINDAYKWYTYTEDGYKRGQTPKLGAIACWTYTDKYGDKCGHVAVVESIDNGVITFSNSAWGYLNFYLTTADVDDKHAGESDWDFKGYIYIDEFASPTPSTPADYKTGIYQVTVDDYLNVRTSASTSSSIAGYFYDGDKINVTRITESGGIVWGYASSGYTTGWVSLQYCKFLYEYDIDPDDYDRGDVNLNGIVDVADVTTLQLYLANALSFNDGQKTLADINNNGKIDVTDVTTLQMLLAGYVV